MKTAYEVGLFNWNIGIYLCAIASVVFICLLIHILKQKVVIELPKLLILIIISFVLVFAVIIGLIHHYTQYYDLKSGNYIIVEGRISNFKKVLKGDEVFSVNGHDFILHIQGDMSQPFHSTDFIKKLSENNSSVKIYYSGNHILKVEYQ